MSFTWNHSYDIANKDCTVLKKWERGQISTEFARRELGRNNGCPSPTEAEFLKLANALGYFRERYSENE